MTKLNRNIQFTNLIKAGGRLREFNFRRSQGINDPMFTIDVADERGERHYVIFHLKEGRWIPENNKMLDFIREVLPQIEKTIDEFK
jgi:hypothetical protein